MPPPQALAGPPSAFPASCSVEFTNDDDTKGNEEKDNNSNNQGKNNNELHPPSPPPIHHSLLVPVIHGLLCINQAACVQLTYRNSQSAELIDGGPLPSALHYHYSPNVYEAQGSRC